MKVQELIKRLRDAEPTDEIRVRISTAEGPYDEVGIEHAIVFPLVVILVPYVELELKK